MTDNGGTGGVKLFNAGMRGMKATYLRWRTPRAVLHPLAGGGLRPAGDVDALTENQDLLPTLIDLCGLAKPSRATFDGANCAPLLRGRKSPELDGRMCVVQCALWDEYEHANKWAGAVLWNKWRLVRGEELYDLRSDPGQKTNIAAQHPDVVAKMRTHYEQWWSKVEPLAHDFLPIHLGSKDEPLTVLTSHNWVAPNTADQSMIRKGDNRSGPWHVLVERAGPYEILLRRWPEEAAVPLAAAAPPYKGKLANYPAGKALPIIKARLKIAAIDETKATPSDDTVAFRVTLPAGPTTLQTWFFDAAGKDLCGAYYVYCKRLP